MTRVIAIEKPENPQNNQVPLIFDSPHSGSIYPDDFGYACNFEELRRAKDHYVDELFENTPHHGATFLTALFPRSYIDVNRAECDIDPQLLETSWPAHLGDHNPTGRSDAGIGLIRRLVKPGIPVYDRALKPEEIHARIQNYYRPYHEALQNLLDAAHYNFGCVYHINCHSMPASSAATKRAGSFIAPSFIGQNPRSIDICIGDRDGSTASKEFTQITREFFKNQGLSVSINDPFKGVELIKRYAAPTRGRHSIQIEINKALYMNEETGAKTADFETLKATLDHFTETCAAYIDSQLVQKAAD